MPTRTIVKKSLKLLLLSLGEYLPEKEMPILLYHSIDNLETEDSVSPEVFFDQMEYLYKEGYRVISLDEIPDYMNNSNKRGLSKILAITFDDGYKSIYKFAMPVLQKFDFTASVFLPTKYIGKCSEWIKPSMPLLNWNEIIAMKENGILFGSHGHSHRDLTALTAEEATEELEVSKRILEDKLGSSIFYISYPFSKSNRIIENLALKCGYRTSFSGFDTKRGKMQKSKFILSRRVIIKKDDMLSFKFVLANTYHYYFSLKRLLYWPTEMVRHFREAICCNVPIQRSPRQGDSYN